ncbi:MCP four helix bundle domain-containing protein [Paenibacillus flagellatus]|uniref:MCP four helix bundle domain-containing protein n=1 Tax=Paenibacillus flagellatus TaxID=2211139 RepID=UPI0024831BFB|nr:MCP four helix bundle domain-containing protein [Paenibacillus flagellatus]
MKWFHDWKTSVKLLAAFVSLAVLLAVVGVFGIANMSRLDSSMDQLYGNNLTSVRLLSQTQIDYTEIRVSLRKIALTERTEDVRFGRKSTASEN